MIQDSESRANAFVIKPVIHAFDVLLDASSSLTSDGAFMVSLEARLTVQIQEEKAQ